MWISVCNFNHQLEKVVGCKSSSVHHTMKIKKMLGHKTLWCTNIATSSQERWIRANSVFDHNFLEQTLLNTCATYEHFDGSQNNPLICLGLWEKKAQTHNQGLELKQNWKYVFHKPRQIPYLLSCCPVTRLEHLFKLDRWLAVELYDKHFFSLFLGQTCMILTLNLET